MRSRKGPEFNYIGWDRSRKFLILILTAPDEYFATNDRQFGPRVGAKGILKARRRPKKGSTLTGTGTTNITNLQTYQCYSNVTALHLLILNTWEHNWSGVYRRNSIKDCS